MDKVVESGQRLNITATNADIKYGNLMGVFVSQTTGTIKLADDGGTIANTFSPIAGTYYPLPCEIVGTLTVTITGTMDATIFYV